MLSRTIITSDFNTYIHSIVLFQLDLEEEGGPVVRTYLDLIDGLFGDEMGSMNPDGCCDDCDPVRLIAIVIFPWKENDNR